MAHETRKNNELDVLLDSAQSQSTKYNTSFAVSVYKKLSSRKNAYYKEMLGLNTEISIKSYKIYDKFKHYLFSEWAQHIKSGKTTTRTR